MTPANPERLRERRGKLEQARIRSDINKQRMVSVGQLGSYRNSYNSQELQNSMLNRLYKASQE